MVEWMLNGESRQDRLRLLRLRWPSKVVGLVRRLQLQWHYLLALALHALVGADAAQVPVDLELLELLGYRASLLAAEVLLRGQDGSAELLRELEFLRLN